MQVASTRVRMIVATAVLLVAAAAPAAPTPTPTPRRGDTPMGGATVSATPTPRPTAAVFPNPARSGQRVTLDASATVTVFSPRWSQVGGDVALEIEDADAFVASFVAPAVSAATVVRVRFALVSAEVISFLDFDVTILPADTVALTIVGAIGPPGGRADLGVRLDPVGLAVGALRHEIGFDPEAAIAARADGGPDCEPGPDVAVSSASFEFLPAGCAPAHACTAVRAQLVAAEAIVAPLVAYRCRVALTDETAESCTHALRCAGGEAGTADGAPLALSCTDGMMGSFFEQRDPQISLHAEPAEPSVGDTVRLDFSVVGQGGIPTYHLIGTWPFLEGDTTARGSLPGAVTFTLRAQRAGTVQLQLSANYETIGGCPGQTYYFFRTALSPLFGLTIQDPAGLRVAGRVAEFPLGCEGAMRGVTVRLEPGGFSTQTDVAAGEFAFDGISPGDYTLTVSPSCNPFGCWPPRDVHVAAEDQFVTVCPRAEVCVGDCNGDGRVRIDELIAGVRMALGDTLTFACAAAFDLDGSGAVLIGDLVAAVSAALDGCGAQSNTTPSPTPPPSPTPA